MSSCDEDAYRAFKAKFLDQQPSKALIEQSVQFLQDKDEEWMSAFRIHLSNDLMNPSHSPQFAQLRTRALFILNKYFPVIGQNITRTAWQTTMIELIPHCIRCVDAKLELGHVCKLVSGWNAYFDENLIKEWVAEANQKQQTILAGGEAYQAFKTQYLVQQPSKALIEQSVNELSSKDESWLSVFRIYLYQDLICKETSLDYARIRTRAFFILHKYFQSLPSNVMETIWQPIMMDIVPHCIQSMGKDAEAQLTHVGRLLNFWKSLFPESLINEWVHLLEEQQRTLGIPIGATAAATAPTTNSLPAASGKRQFDEAFSATSSAASVPAPSTVSENGPIEPVSIYTHTNDDFIMLVLRSAIEPTHHANAHTVTTTQMNQLTIRLCQYYLERCREPSEQVYWRLLLLSSVWLIHKHGASYQLGEDKIAIAFACVYLAGKIEHMFLKHQKLVDIATVVAPPIFGTSCTVVPSSSATSSTIIDTTDSESNSSNTSTSSPVPPNNYKEIHLPDEDKLICYETELLQLIQYDANSIQNPIHPLKKLFEEGKLLSERQYYDALRLLCKDEILLEKEIWEFSESVIAFVFAMMVKHTEADNSDMSDLFECSLYESIRDNESIMNILKFISFVSQKTPNVLPSPDRTRMVERLTAVFLEGTALSTSDVDQSLLPVSMRR